MIKTCGRNSIHAKRWWQRGFKFLGKGLSCSFTIQEIQQKILPSRILSTVYTCVHDSQHIMLWIFTMTLWHAKASTVWRQEMRSEVTQHGMISLTEQWEIGGLQCDMGFSIGMFEGKSATTWWCLCGNLPALNKPPPGLQLAMYLSRWVVSLWISHYSLLYCCWWLGY